MSENVPLFNADWPSNIKTLIFKYLNRCNTCDNCKKKINGIIGRFKNKVFCPDCYNSTIPYNYLYYSKVTTTRVPKIKFLNWNQFIYLHCTNEWKRIKLCQLGIYSNGKICNNLTTEKCSECNRYMCTIKHSITNAFKNICLLCRDFYMTNIYSS